MADSINIGSVPVEEQCAEVGRDSDRTMRFETIVFKNQLIREFPNGRFFVKANRHDFGTYYEVEAQIDTGNKEADETAFDAEANTPEYWDENALSVLMNYGEEGGKSPELDEPIFAVWRGYKERLEKPDCDDVAVVRVNDEGEETWACVNCANRS